MTSLSPAERALLNLLGRRGGLLTAGEAATRSGFPLAEVEPALLQLAVASGADLRVADDGTVAYRFAPHLRRRLLARSWQLRLEAAASWLWQRLFGLIRISFGLVLVVLVAVVSLVVLLVALVQILRSDDGAEVVLQLLWGALELLARVLVLLFSDGFSSSGGLPADRQRSGSGAQPSGLRGPGGGKRFQFFESVYSVLFGDGDPNRSLERRRWIRIGCFLQHRGGAVIAEDLAPLLDLPARPADGQRASDLADAAMLAVLQRFDGRPAVSEQGDLAFHFPSLQVQAEGRATDRWDVIPDGAELGSAEPDGEPGKDATPPDAPLGRPPDGQASPSPATPGAFAGQPPAALPRTALSRTAPPRTAVLRSATRGERVGSGPVAPSLPAAPLRPAPALRERRIPFSRVPRSHRRLYAAMSCGLLLLSPALLLITLPLPPPTPLVGLALVSMAYALLLVLVPLLRLLVLRRRNARIAIRNARRRTWTRHDPLHRHRLERKRVFAQGLARRRRLGSADLAYTTEQGLLEQSIEQAGRD